MPLYDVRCAAGHEVERWAGFNERSIACDVDGCGLPTERVWRTNTNSRHADVTWPGGKTFTNGFSSPQTFYSPKEYREALAAKGLKVKEENDRTVTSLSAHGLKHAEDLIARMYPDARHA